jgi:hypothetical protein
MLIEVLATTYPLSLVRSFFFLRFSLLAVLMRSSVQIAANVLVGLFVSHSALAAPVQCVDFGSTSRI